STEAGAIVIGPAGENRVRFALTENDRWRSAGRTGVGAVMGAKRLKALVFHGDRRRPCHDPETLSQYARDFLTANRDNPSAKAYKALGTTMVSIMNKAGAFPSRYWSQGTCEHWERISGETFHREHSVRPRACAKCFMACGRRARIAHGRRAGLVIEGPEYETIYAFGGLCMIEDMGEIAYLNDLCDRLGMDTITAGNLCAFAIEAVRRGRVEYPIAYGDSEGVAALLKHMAGRIGIGDVLAEGIAVAARAWGLDDIAVHVKGLEPAGYDPRVLKGMGLAYATAGRGACHLRTTFYKPELSGMIDPGAVEGKAELLVEFEDRLTLFDSLILCRFYRDMYDWDALSQVISLTTGTRLSREALRQRAVAITTMTRKFNLREGMTANQDRLPNRLHREPLPSGHGLTEDELERMLVDYYRLRGWDQDGIPPDLV
ncbi:aldehyde ferredoxin oxidoreductase family protein, partial [Thermodesulfobacteriota bacterium]